MDHAGTARWRSICSVVRVWYSDFSRMITSLMSLCLLSLGLDAGFARQGGPFWDFGRDIAGQLSRAVTDYFGTLLAQLIADIRQCEGRHSSVVQTRQNRSRRASRREQGI